MPQITFRMNLQTRHFPLLSSLQGQTVVIPERDQTYVPNVNPSEDQVTVDRGIPTIYYAENVMPSTFGFQSIGYRQKVNGFSGVTMDSVQSFPRTTNGYTTHVAIDLLTAKTIFVLDINGNWKVPTGAPTNLGEYNKLSVATVNGVSYVCVARRGVYKITQGVTPSLTQVTLKGLSNSTIEGILTSVGYLITWSLTGVAWSSTTDPLDFVPDPGTGAGSGDIQDASGDLVWCQSTSYGFIIYTKGNAVQATWSGNTQHPWNFRGIPASGGISSGNVVSKDANGQHYVYTTNGLQQVFHTGAKTVLPFITDFISGRVIDNWDAGLNQVVEQTSPGPMPKKVAFISDRYLCISYGLSNAPQFSHAIVFDLVQSRLGKLKADHIHCFEYHEQEDGTVETPRDSIAFMKRNGEIQTVNFELTSRDRIGRMLLGKFQVARGLMSQLVQIDVENTDADNFTLDNLPSLNGKDPTSKENGFDMTEVLQSYNKVFNFHAWGKSHTLLVEGCFNLVSAELTLRVDGKVR